jgi:hypothetical protein
MSHALSAKWSVSVSRVSQYTHASQTRPSGRLRLEPFALPRGSLVVSLCGFLAAVSWPLLFHCCSLCDLRLFVNKRMLFCLVLAPSVRRESMQYTLAVCWRLICKNGTCSGTKQQMALRCRKVVCQPARQVLTNRTLCVRQYTKM